MDYISHVEHLRRSQNFLTIFEILRLIEAGNIIHDPFSTLISKNITIGSGNIIYPCVSLLSKNQSHFHIGDNNTFNSTTFIEASTGPISIGSNNIFGEGGFTAKTNQKNSSIFIEDFGRYNNGACVYGKSKLGAGSQILGAITVDSCILSAGASHQETDVQLRAGLLKGNGIAKNLHIPQGYVISGNGFFDEADLKPQSFFHPVKK